MSIITATRPLPAAMAHSYQLAIVRGVMSLVTSLVVLIAATTTHVGSSSLWGFAGEIILVTAVVVAIIGMSARPMWSKLNPKGEPIMKSWNIPGADWTYVDYNGRTVDMTHAYGKTCNFNTVTAWRHVGLALVHLSFVLLFVGSIIVGNVALDLSGIDLSVEYLLL